MDNLKGSFYRMVLSARWGLVNSLSSRTQTPVSVWGTDGVPEETAYA